MRRLVPVLLLLGCGARVDVVDSGTMQQEQDSGTMLVEDSGTVVLDSGVPDSGTTDIIDSGVPDAGAVDSGVPDAGTTTTMDAGPPQPPPFPTYSNGACPSSWGTNVQIVDGGTVTTVQNFMSGTTPREFKLIVPRDYDPSRAYPLIFTWHWLNASASSFVREGELSIATEQLDFIAVAPEAKRKSNGDKQYTFNWPFVEGTTNANSPEAAEELRFFDDLLACVSQSHNIDRRRVHAMGVSAGGLWATYLMGTSRAAHFASFLIISGGLGRDPLGFFDMMYRPVPNKFPALVLWGGPSDFLGLDFNAASIRLKDALIADNHFVTTCTHNAGHAMPPIPQPAMGTKFRPLYQFLMDHPFGLPPRTSPWQQSGMPTDMPTWCAIATP